MNDPLSTLNITVTQAFPDGDKIIADYRLGIVLDDVNREDASEIVAYYLRQMDKELQMLDRHVHPVQ